MSKFKPSKEEGVLEFLAKLKKIDHFEIDNSVNLIDVLKSVEPLIKKFPKDDEACKALIALGKEVTIKDERDKFGNNALIYAAEQGWIKTADCFLKQFPSVVDEQEIKKLISNPLTNITAIHIAASNGNLDLLQLLITKFPRLINDCRQDHKDTPNKSPAKTALDVALALSENHPNKVKIIEFLKSKSGMKASHVHLYMDATNMLKSAQELETILTNYKGDQEDVRDVFVTKAILNQIISGRPYQEIIDYLNVLANHKMFDLVNFRDKTGASIFHIALSHGRMDVITHMKEKLDLDINMLDTKDKTILDVAEDRHKVELGKIKGIRAIYAEKLQANRLGFSTHIDMIIRNKDKKIASIPSKEELPNHSPEAERSTTPPTPTGKKKSKHVQSEVVNTGSYKIEPSTTPPSSPVEMVPVQELKDRKEKLDKIFTATPEVFALPIEAGQYKGLTALEIATKTGHIELFEYLLDKDFSLINKKGTVTTFMREAANHPEIITLLETKYKANHAKEIAAAMNEKLSESDGAALDQAYLMHKDIVDLDKKCAVLQRFIDLGAQVKGCKNEQEIRGLFKTLHKKQYNTAMKVIAIKKAFEESDKKILDELLAKDLFLIHDSFTNEGFTALFAAVHLKSEALIKYLIGKDVSIICDRSLGEIEGGQGKPNNNIFHYELGLLAQELPADLNSKRFLVLNYVRDLNKNGDVDKALAKNNYSTKSSSLILKVSSAVGALLNLEINARNLVGFTPLDSFYSYAKDWPADNKQLQQTKLSMVAQLTAAGFEANVFKEEIRLMQLKLVKKEFVALIKKIEQTKKFEDADSKNLLRIIEDSKKLGDNKLVNTPIDEQGRNALFVAVDLGCPGSMVSTLLYFTDINLGHQLSQGNKDNIFHHVARACAAGKIGNQTLEVFLADANNKLGKKPGELKGLLNVKNFGGQTALDAFFESSRAMDKAQKVGFIKKMKAYGVKGDEKIDQFLRQVAYQEFAQICNQIITDQTLLESNKVRLDQILKDYPFRDTRGDNHYMVDQSVKDGKTALTLAVENDNKEFISYLLAKHAKVDLAIPNDVLLIAMKNKNYYIFDKLFEKLTVANKPQISQALNSGDSQILAMFLQDKVKQIGNSNKHTLNLSDEQFQFAQKLVYMGAKAPFQETAMTRYELDTGKSFTLNQKPVINNYTKTTKFGGGLGLLLVTAGVISLAVPPVAAALGAGLAIVATILFVAAAASFIAAGVSAYVQEKFHFEPVRIDPDRIKQLQSEKSDPDKLNQLAQNTKDMGDGVSKPKGFDQMPKGQQK